jgi:hypothetical protein
MLALRSGRIVRQFRQILIWPLELMPLQLDAQIRSHEWDLLTGNAGGADPLWTKVDEELPADPGLLHERHYREFGTFLTHVQRLLYGERATRSGGSGYQESPAGVFRRRDIAQARVTFNEGASPLLFNVD